MYPEKISLDLEEENRSAIGILRIVSERTLEIDAEQCLLHRLAEGI